jgi:hypothetical protein
LLVTCISILMGCSRFSTIGELPGISKIESQINNIAITPQLSVGNFDERRFAECMLPLVANIKPGLIEMAVQAKSLNGDWGNDLMHRLSRLDSTSLADDASLLGKLLGHISTATKLPGKDSDSLLRQRVKDDLDGFLRRLKQDQHPFQTDTKQVFALGGQYFLAYFKKGGLQAVEQTISDKAEREKGLEKAAELLQRKPDDPVFLKAANLLMSELNKASRKAERKASGFIGRDGTQYGFPGTSEQDGRVSIDHNQVSADGIRLLLEAFRDTFAPLPVLVNSTAAQQGGLAQYAIAFDNQGQLIRETDADGQLLPGWEEKYQIGADGGVQLIWHFDRHDAANSATITINEDKFQKIEAHARKAEAQVAGSIGKAIRGGSWGALNNEAIATLLETAVGVVARHTAERGEWCLLAQESIAQNQHQP